MKLITRMVALLFFLQVVAPPAYAAEQLVLPAPDVEPPVIVFDEPSAEIEAGEKVFSATVTDNIGVANVTLYFKGSTDVAFTARKMYRSSANPNVYTTELFLDPVISNKLEVYVRADDVSGNSIFEGQKFSPLTYTIVAKDGDEVVQSVTEPAAAEEEGMSTLTMILIGVGVLALAGGGGGGGGGGVVVPTTGSVTINSDLP